MNESENRDSKSKVLGLKSGTNTVRQSFSHGRSKSVVVETRKKKFIVSRRGPLSEEKDDIVQTKDLKKRKYIFSLGQDALSPDLTAQMIFEKISKSEVPIKQILLNQKLIAGIGNIYASEILFDSKISPLTLGKDLEISLIMKLIKSTRKILKKAIKYGGSSIRDYRSTDGTLGNFQSNFKVYNKEGKKIGNDKVKKIIQYGRSTFYCPKLQNNK